MTFGRSARIRRMRFRTGGRRHRSGGCREGFCPAADCNRRSVWADRDRIHGADALRSDRNPDRAARACRPPPTKSSACDRLNRSQRTGPPRRRLGPDLSRMHAGIDGEHGPIVKVRSRVWSLILGKRRCERTGTAKSRKPGLFAAMSANSGHLRGLQLGLLVLEGELVCSTT